MATMKAKFAKALAANISTIAGNVAHVALMDAGAIPNDNSHPPNRAQACAKVAECERNIASLLMQPGCTQTDEQPAELTRIITLHAALLRCKQAAEDKTLPPSARLELVRDIATPLL